jgi:hypothetical protein
LYAASNAAVKPPNPSVMGAVHDKVGAAGFFGPLDKVALGHSPAEKSRPVRAGQYLLGGGLFGPLAFSL